MDADAVSSMLAHWSPVTLALSTLILSFAATPAAAGPIHGAIDEGPQSPGVHFEDSFEGGLDPSKWTSSAYAAATPCCGSVVGSAALVVQPPRADVPAATIATRGLELASGSVVSLWTRAGEQNLDGWYRGNTLPAAAEAPLAPVLHPQPDCGPRVDLQGHPLDLQFALHVRLPSCASAACGVPIWEADISQLAQWVFLEIPLPQELAVPGAALALVYNPNGRIAYVSPVNPAWIIDDVRVQSIAPSVGVLRAGAPVLCATVPAAAPAPVRNEDAGVRAYDCRAALAGQDNPDAETYAYAPTDPSAPTPGLAAVSCDLKAWPGHGNGPTSGAFCDRDNDGVRGRDEEGLTLDGDGDVAFTDHFDGTDVGSTATCTSLDYARWSLATGFVAGCALFLRDQDIAVTRPMALDGHAVVRIRVRGHTGDGVGAVEYRDNLGPWQRLATFQVTSAPGQGFEFPMPAPVHERTGQFRVVNLCPEACRHQESQVLVVDDVTVMLDGRLRSPGAAGIEADRIDSGDVRAEGFPGETVSRVASGDHAADVRVYRDRDGDGDPDPDETIVEGHGGLRTDEPPHYPGPCVYEEDVPTGNPAEPATRVCSNADYTLPGAVVPRWSVADDGTVFICLANFYQEPCDGTTADLWLDPFVHPMVCAETYRACGHAIAVYDDRNLNFQHDPGEPYIRAVDS